MKDNEYLNILTYGQPTGTISIKPHPEDIIEVDPVVIARMKARLKGENFTNIYDISDRVIDELSLQQEKNKLKRIFGSESQIIEAFSSIKNIHNIQEEISFEEVDKKLLSDHALIKSGEFNVDEMDFYRSFLFDNNLINKEQRISKVKSVLDKNSTFKKILDDYRTKHFETLKISKEIIQIDNELKQLFQERKLASMFDNFLNLFYGLSI